MLLCNIPIQYKEGVFGFYEFEDYANDMEDSQIIALDYTDYGEIVEYTVPIVSEDDDASNDLTLYGIPEDELVQTLQAAYNKNGRLEKITAHIKTRKCSSIFIMRTERRQSKKFKNLHWKQQMP